MGAMGAEYDINMDSEIVKTKKLYLSILYFKTFSKYILHKIIKLLQYLI